MGKVEFDKVPGRIKHSINISDQHYLYSAGVATPDPGEAPPMAGVCLRSHFILKIIGDQQMVL